MAWPTYYGEENLDYGYNEPYEQENIDYGYTEPVKGQGAGSTLSAVPEYPLMPQRAAAVPVVAHPGAGYSEYERSKTLMREPPRNAGMATLGSRPFFIPSGAGKTTSRYPGYTERGGTTVMPAPTIGPMPEFKLPLWDEKKIESKAQRAAGPGLRELRKGMREAQGRYYENPNVRRMTLRDAMAGYGMGLEKVLGGARREAQAEYGAEYAPQVAKAQAEYGGQVNTMMAQYQNAWREYLTRMQTTVSD